MAVGVEMTHSCQLEVKGTFLRLKGCFLFPEISLSKVGEGNWNREKSISKGTDSSMN